MTLKLNLEAKYVPKMGIWTKAFIKTEMENFD